MGYDNILVKVGDFGLYQKLLCGFFVFYTTFLCGLNYYTQVFIFDTPEHRCSDTILDSYQNNFQATWEDMLPLVPRERGYPSKCTKTTFGASSHSYLNSSSTYLSLVRTGHASTNMESLSVARSSVIREVEAGQKVACDQGWSYDHSLVFNTITSENDWVCENDYKPMMIHTIFWVGNTVGCFLWGFTNDFFGRKPTVLMTHGLYFLAGTATLFVSNFYLLAICRFLVGCAHHTISHLPYLIVVEYCGVASRTVPLLMVMVSYTTASVTVPWLAMALPSWRLLAMVAASLVLPVVACWK